MPAEVANGAAWWHREYQDSSDEALEDGSSDEEALEEELAGLQFDYLAITLMIPLQLFHLPLAI